MPREQKRLEWSRTAAREFVAGIAFIAEDSLQGASLVKGRIDKAASLLRLHPRMGKPETVAGTWKFPVPKTHYTLIYAETSEAICILHCWHQSRRSTLEYG